MSTLDNDLARPQDAESAADPVRESLLGFLRARTKSEWTADQDLFASGAVSSLFYLELLQFVEQEFQVTVEGDDITLDNFRTVHAMAALVGRLRAGASGEPGPRL
ncbi:methoxymalonate biosynthesis protein [Streptomyces cyaneogriseus subsp. noncyanogenus]|jgi:methoxymalonate biosynthesis acyl carrier protein|uniref:Methoxymalonate biosynthesis protein n=1 Tax=Streptomyces cyaneogriseus subsp. noncyanogenus TaxID=477245 RepID=A0A0C5GKX7_9ACTN|nr:acyl carrier protein [Streptomyces cyaneogriseus]AJP05146.1 methoxymalonate biosynthesis protein [Streptomyces cyaneogriseus subsp. noncyanogenus]